MNICKLILKVDHHKPDGLPEFNEDLLLAKYSSDKETLIVNYKERSFFMNAETYAVKTKDLGIIKYNYISREYSVHCSPEYVDEMRIELVNHAKRMFNIMIEKLNTLTESL